MTKERNGLQANRFYVIKGVKWYKNTKNTKMFRNVKRLP